MYLLPALLLGFIAGMRTMSAPAAAAWAVRAGVFTVADTPVAFMGFRYTPYIFTLLALGELVADKLPTTPSRKTPGPFIARIVSGALCGATVAASSGALVPGALAGAAGAVVGTYACAALRGRLAAAFGKDLPAALLEDAVALGLCVLVVTRF